MHDFIDTVEISPHAKNRTEGEHMNLPESIAKNIVKNGKGMLYFDNKHDTYIRQYNKTAVAYNVEDGHAIIRTAYRANPRRYRNTDRFERMN